MNLYERRMKKLKDDATIDDCMKCKERKLIVGGFLDGMCVCNCSCGRASKNAYHPLSPCCYNTDDERGCVCGTDEDGNLDCEKDDDAIILEGGRCLTLIMWYRLMDQYNGPNYKYPEKW